SWTRLIYPNLVWCKNFPVHWSSSCFYRFSRWRHLGFYIWLYRWQGRRVYDAYCRYLNWSSLLACCSFIDSHFAYRVIFYYSSNDDYRLDKYGEDCKGRSFSIKNAEVRTDC